MLAHPGLAPGTERLFTLLFTDNSNGEDSSPPGTVATVADYHEAYSVLIRVAVLPHRHKTLKTLNNYITVELGAN